MSGFPKLLTMKHLLDVLGLKNRSSVVNLEKGDPDFPRRIRIGRYVRWHSDEITDYINLQASRRPK